MGEEPSADHAFAQAHRIRCEIAVGEYDDEGLARQHNVIGHHEPSPRAEPVARCFHRTIKLRLHENLRWTLSRDVKVKPSKCRGACPKSLERL